MKIKGPESGKLSKVIHLADIHIRPGDRLKSRYDEYSIVFTRLIEILSGLDCVKDHECVIVVCGDIFHVKNHTDSLSMKLFNIFISSLGRLAPTYIIQGNHDYRQDLIDCPDILSGLFYENQKYNIEYLHDTGCYTVDGTDVGFSVVSVKDTLVAGDTHQQVDDLPPFPTDFEENVSMRIALFHGTVIHAKYQNYTEATEGYPLDWFAGHDIVMLGDIHLQQIDMDGAFPWGYPGSLIQQNIGEAVFGHGFLLWDLETKTATEHHITNDFGSIYLRLRDSKWQTMVRRKYVDLETVSGLPINLSIIIRGNSTHDDLLGLDDIFGKQGIQYKILKGALRNDLVEIADDVGKGSIEGLCAYNSPQTWIDYIDEKLKTIGDAGTIDIDWKQWIMHPETLIVNDPVRCVASTVKSCNDDIIKEVNKLEMSLCSDVVKNSLKLVYLEWKWLFCYADNCWIDFTDSERNICVINGDNSFGKSSFFDIICLALFGSNITSRYNDKHSAGVICTQKPTDLPAESSIIFEINGIEYSLHRRYQHKDIHRLEIKEVTLSEYDVSEEKYVIIKSGTKAINEWIGQNIGSKDQFLLSCMLTQKSDKDFFSLKAPEQTKLLEGALNIESIKLFENVFRVAINKHKTIIKNTRDQRQDSDEIDVISSPELKSNGIESKIDNENNDEITRLEEELRGININTEFITDYALDEAKIMKKIDLFEKRISENKVEEDREVLLERRGKLNAEIEQLGKINKKHICTLDIAKKQLKKKIVVAPVLSEEDYIAWKTNYDNILKSIPNLKKLIKFCKDKNMPDNDGDPIEMEAEVSHQQKMIEDKKLLKLDADALEKCYMETEKTMVSTFDRQQTLNEEIKQHSIDMTEIRTQLEKQEKIIEDIVDVAKPGCLIEDCEKWFEQYDILSKTIDHDRIEYERVNTIMTEYSNLQSKHNEATAQIESLEEEIKDLPFNPKCKSCQAQPWRVKIRNFKAECIELNDKIEIIEKEHNIDDLNNILDRLEEIVDRYDDMCTKIDDWNDKRDSCIAYNLFLEKRLIEREKLHEIRSKYKALDAIIEKERTEISQLILNYDKIRIQYNDISYVRSNYNEWQKTMEYIANSEKFQQYNQYCSVSEQKDEWDQYIIQRDQYNDWKTKYNCSKYAVLSAECDDIGIMLSNLDKLDEYQHTLEHWNMVLNNKASYIRQCKIETQLGNLRRKQMEITTELAKNSVKLEHNQQISATNKAIDDFIVMMEGRKSALMRLMEIFKGFKNWLYGSKIVPNLIIETNKIVDPILDTDCYLDGGVNENVEFSWFIADGDNISTVQTAGGFREFIFGLAIRIAMSYLGATSVMCNQLFIDEGFVAGSSNNLEKIPEFIKGLLGVYDSVFLVTHLDVVRQATEKTICIERLESQKLSRIQCGKHRKLLADRRIRVKVGVNTPLPDGDITLPKPEFLFSDEDRCGLCKVILKNGKLCKAKVKKDADLCSRHYKLING
jgi:DNA repair exonuclease SbcCD ATPase subunit